MKPLLALLSLAILSSIIGCSNKVVPLQYTYQDGAYQFSVSSTKDEVWTKLVDLLTSKGLAIKTIDKNTGLITTDNVSFLNSYSFENKDGTLTRPGSFVVCTKVRGPFTFSTSLKPDSITGQWTVLTKQADSKVTIEIRLVNASGKIFTEEPSLYGQEINRVSHNLVVKSTDVFEKSIEVAFK